MQINQKEEPFVHLSIFATFLLLLFTACQSNSASITPDIITQTVPTTSDETVLSDTTMKPVTTITHESFETPAPPPITPMPSPIPTLSLTDKKMITSEFYEANGNCELPCWWGIIPGKTDWQEAELLLNSVAIELYTSAESEFDDRYSVGVDLPVSVDLSSRELLIQYYWIVNGKVMLIESEAPRPSSKIYTVSKILNMYGRPKEVQIETYAYSHGEINTFSIALFYPDKGILVRYGALANFLDDYVSGCVGSGTGSVVVWSPEQNLSFAEALNGTRGLGTFGEQYYKSLEEATEMDIETFYQTYLDPDTETCIETPAELWMDR